MTAPGPQGSPTVSVPEVPDTVAWAEVDGEVVAYDEVGKKVHLLSPTATLAWSGIDGRTSFEQIARDLSDSFGEDPAIIRADVQELADDLASRGLIREAGSAEATASASAPPGVEGASAWTPAGKTRFLEDPPSG